MDCVSEKNSPEKYAYGKKVITDSASVFSGILFFIIVSIAVPVSAQTINLEDLPTVPGKAAADEASRVEDLQVKQLLRGVYISWKKISLQETEAVVLVRSENRCPLLPRDGAELYRGNGDSYQDETTLAGMKYCYGLFVTDSSGRYSRMVVSDLIEKDGAVTHFFSRIDGNKTIAAGVIIVIILAWMHKKTVYDLNRRKKRMVVL